MCAKVLRIYANICVNCAGKNLQDWVRLLSWISVLFTVYFSWNERRSDRENCWYYGQGLVRLISFLIWLVCQKLTNSSRTWSISAQLRVWYKGGRQY